MAQRMAQSAAPPFRMSTRQKLTQVPSVAMATLGGADIPIVLPNSGYMGNIYVNVDGTVSTGAGTPGGHFNGYPYLPFSLIKNFSLKNNMGGALMNASGFGMKLLDICRRPKQAELQTSNPFNLWNTTNQSHVWNAPARSSVVAASTAYNVAADWCIPVPTDDALMLGLVLSQSNNLYNVLTVTPAAQSDIQGDITGVTPLSMNVNVNPAVEYFDIPKASGSQPDTTWLHSIFEELQTGVATSGDIIYRPAPGPVYLRIIGMVEAGSPLTPAAYGGITKIQFRYGQSNYVYIESYQEHLARMYAHYGIVLPDGMFVYDWTLGYGTPGIVEPRDFMDTSQFTDVQIVVSVTGLGANPQIRWVREFLAPDTSRQGS